MANIFDYNKLSTYIGGVVDRKLRSVAMCVSDSTSYLRTLVKESSDSADEASASAASARTSSDNATSVWDGFTRTFLGINAADPTKSILNKTINKGAFHVREGDKRLRFATAIAADGTPTWEDVKTLPDQQGVLDIVLPRFMALSDADGQIVEGPVAFANPVTIPDTQNWDSDEAANASSIKAYLTEAINQSIISKFARGTNSFGHWELRPGVLEMWGSVTVPATSEIIVMITLPVRAPSATYNISTTPAISVNNQKQDLWTQIINSYRTADSFTIQYQSATRDDNGLAGFDWRVIMRVPDNFTVAENISAAPDPGTISGGGGSGGGGTGTGPGQAV